MLLLLDPMALAEQSTIHVMEERSAVVFATVVWVL